MSDTRDELKRDSYERLEALNAEMLAWLKEEAKYCAPLSTRGRKLLALIAKASNY